MVGLDRHAALIMLGKWLDRCGWPGALVKAGITTSGRAQALIFASHVKQKVL